MILVTGATGRAGSQVVRALLEQSDEVRALVRDPVTARDLLGEDVELVVGDFADVASVRVALEGVSDVFLSGPDDPRRVGWETAAIDAAAAAGVRRIVKLSSIVAAPGAPVAFWDWHGRIENHLRQSAIPGWSCGQLLHVEPAAGRRACRARGQALRTRGGRENRDDRSARRRGGQGGRPRHGGS